MTVGATMTSPQTLAIIHDCISVSPADLESFTVALQFAFDEHFDPIWGTSTTVEFIEPGGHITDGSWQILVRDEPPPEEANDLGFHTDTGEPIAYVFAKASVDDGTPWSVPLSHEAFEMRIDPETNLTMPLIRDGVSGLTAKEVCDACQDPRWGFQVQGLNGQMWTVSAVLTPAWFDPNGMAPFSHPVIPPIDAPGRQADGGYLPWKADGGQWEQIFADIAGPLQAPRVGSRFHRICQTDSGLDAMGSAV